MNVGQTVFVSATEGSGRVHAPRSVDCGCVLVSDSESSLSVNETSVLRRGQQPCESVILWKEAKLSDAVSTRTQIWFIQDGTRHEAT